MSENTKRAYAKDWADFSRWCRLKGVPALPPSPEIIGHYIGDLAPAALPCPLGAPTRPLSGGTIERRLFGLAWNYKQRGFILDRKDPHIATALAMVKAVSAEPSVQKEVIFAEDILAMVATLPFDLRGLRDRAILLIGFAGGLRRSEIVGLDAHKGGNSDPGGWIEIMKDRAVVTLKAKDALREIEIGRGSSERSCPVYALEQWLGFAKIASGPIFVATSRDGKRAFERRLNDKHIARLIKRTVLDAGLRNTLPENERQALFSTKSLWGHRSALEDEMGKNGFGGRFHASLTKAMGL